MKSKIRLAKANKNIKKNSVGGANEGYLGNGNGLTESEFEVNEEVGLEQIQLSPKKRHEGRKGDEKNNGKSRSKSKSKSKGKRGQSPGKSIDKNKNGMNVDESEENRD